MLITIVVGIYWGKKKEARIATWYERLREGASADDVPLAVRRDVLNTTIRSTAETTFMWVLAGIFFGLLSWSYAPVRVFIGIVGVGGVFAVVMTYFVEDVLWRPVIPVFFPQGALSSVRAFRLPVLGRLLIVFLLIGILPPAILVSLTWQRAQLLLIAPNPQAVLSNLFILQVFILATSVVASIAIAIFMTRGLTSQLDTLQQGMSRVELNDFKVQVSVVTNDELGYLGERFNQMTAGLRQGEMLRNLLNLYVSQEVAREALQRGAKLGGELVECTVLFSDIRGFTSISENLDPEALIDFLNRYMSAMVEVIVNHGGIVNKFGGDSVLAVFGTPLNSNDDHAAQAVRTALAMQFALDKFNRVQKGQDLPALKIGIGIATGPVIAGNVGGEERIEYTVIGDTVNLASRLEGKTKEIEDDILLSEPTYIQASGHITIQATLLPAISVKGKQEPVTVYAVSPPTDGSPARQT